MSVKKQYKVIADQNPNSKNRDGSVIFSGKGFVAEDQTISDDVYRAVVPVYQHPSSMNARLFQKNGSIYTETRAGSTVRIDGSADTNITLAYATTQSVDSISISVRPYTGPLAVDDKWYGSTGSSNPLVYNSASNSWIAENLPISMRYIDGVNQNSTEYTIKLDKFVYTDITPRSILIEFTATSAYYSPSGEVIYNTDVDSIIYLQDPGANAIKFIPVEWTTIGNSYQINLMNQPYSLLIESGSGDIKDVKVGVHSNVNWSFKIFINGQDVSSNELYKSICVPTLKLNGNDCVNPSDFKSTLKNTAPRDPIYVDDFSFIELKLIAEPYIIEQTVYNIELRFYNDDILSRSDELIKGPSTSDSASIIKVEFNIDPLALANRIFYQPLSPYQSAFERSYNLGPEGLISFNDKYPVNHREQYVRSQDEDGNVELVRILPPILE